MRVYGRTGGVLSVILVFLAACSARAEQAAGAVVIVNGDAWIAKASASSGQPAGPINPAHPGDPLFAGDLLATGPSGSVKVKFTDESIFDLGPSSKLDVSQYALMGVEDRVGVFRLVYGRLRALFTRRVSEKGRVEVQTREAVMGVRGTELVVERVRGPAGAISTNLTVVSGLVRVAPPNGVGPIIPVGPGQAIKASPSLFSKAQALGRSIASGGGPVSSGLVANVGTSDLSSKLGSSKAPDNTLFSSVSITDAQKMGGAAAQTLVALGGIVTSVTASIPPPAPPPPTGLQIATIAGASTPNTGPSTQSIQTVGSNVTVTIGVSR